MKKTRLFALLLALLLAATSFAGCGSTPAATPTPTPDTTVTVTDMTDREITLEAPATRVVALTASDCEILYAIGAGDTLVGRGAYCDYPAEVSDIPAVQSGYETNIEQILALEPQVVIMGAMAQTVEQVASLENAGIKVVVSDAQNIEGIYTATTLIGEIVGKNDEAAALVSEMKTDFADIASRVTADSGKTVYFEVSPLQWGLWTTGTDTFMDELATMLGLTNAFADVSGWAEISEEQVIERNPDYIVTNAMYFGEGPTPIEEIMGRQGWQDMTAIVNGKVFNADSDEITRPGPRLVDAAQLLYDFVYGE